MERFAQMALEAEEIWATLYRIGEENALAEALLEAARLGRKVHVLLEGRARFDELLNLSWYLRFLRAGVRVLPLPERKVHAKALLLLTREGGYAHLGTGNYNPQNGRQYTDFSLFTAREEVVRDLLAFFQAMARGEAPRLHLLATGEAIRRLLLEAIENEAHPEGRILLKFNHLTDWGAGGPGPGGGEGGPGGPPGPEHPHPPAPPLPGEEPGGPLPGARPGGGLPERGEVAGLPHQRRRHAPELPRPF